jgi:hypothetical protein
MINVSISLSAKVGALSPETLALFCMLIPHFNAHGKMLANPHLIKGLVCPLVGWLTPEKVKACLVEISEKTSVKFWQDDRGIFYLHSLHWVEHQTLKSDRLGPDHLPSWSCPLPVIPGLVPDNPGVVLELSRKGKGREDEGKEEVEGKTSMLPADLSSLCGMARKAITKTMLSATDIEVIKSWPDVFTQDEIETACQLTRERQGKSVGYIDAILRSERDKAANPKKREENLHHGAAYKPAPDLMAEIKS